MGMDGEERGLVRQCVGVVRMMCNNFLTDMESVINKAEVLKKTAEV